MHSEAQHYSYMLEMDKKNQRSVSEESGQCPLWTLDNIVYEFRYVIVRIFWNDAQKEMKKKQF